ncbi:MFS transporter [Arthrobacter sp. ISL-28]|uniref:MFS transporter n=1 Tax=Arthrobacter sp. ISL-28 TaxID=2819108 RepID=UPI001BED2157|nr:MFS transporter [Arthrobacter sp. ISL-28]MBT2523823.1 MFS transporter [Arthrobacter sp. ISL-28]
MESPWAPLRRRAFFILWIAQLGSNVGSWMQTVGAQWYLVEAGASPTIIALVQTANMAPALLLSLMAGVLADSFNRRKLIIGTNIFAALAATALTLSAALGLLEPVSLLGYTFLIGAGVALSSPAWQAIQPDLVPREEIQSASALGGVTVNAARAVGPAMAGVLVAWAGPAFVFGLNAVSFLTAAAAVYFWRSPEKDLADRESVSEALASGIRYIRSAPRIKRILLRTALFTTPASALWALLPIAADGHLNVGSAGYGLLLGALGAGALLGVVVLPRVRARTTHNTVMAVSALLFGSGAAAAGFLPPAPVAMLMIIAGAAWIGSLSTFSAVMQLTLPAWVRARGMSMYLFVMGGTQALGALLWGAIATAFGYGTALAASSILLIAAAASILVWPLLPGTGQLDRTVSGPAADLHAQAEGTDPGAGPVTVVVTYRPDPERLGDFTAVLDQVRLARLRTGATDWRLVRRIGDTETLAEFYTVPTWREYLRQEQDRLTGEDRRLFTQARAVSREEPSITWYLPAQQEQH